MDQRKIISDNLTTLAKENPKGIELINLEDLYQKKFHSSLVAHLLTMASPEVLSKLNLSKRNKDDGSSELCIQFKSGVALNLLLNGSYRIDTADLVPNEFQYKRNPLSMHREKRFAAQLSLIDTQGILYIQPQESIDRLEQLMKELNQYYANPISDQLWVNNGMVGLACISEHQNQLYRVLIKDCKNSNYLIEYVDYGQTKTVSAGQFRAKYLLNYFASMPIAVIPCRLANINLVGNDDTINSMFQKQINEFCRSDPIFVQFLSNSEINLYNAEQYCLNDLLRRHVSQQPVRSIHYDPLQDYEDDENSSNYESTRSRLQQRPRIENKNGPSHERDQRSSKTNRVSPLYNNPIVPQMMNQNNKQPLIVTPKIDRTMNRFVEWMDSSSHGQSLWRQEKYSSALLNYLASIYNQKVEHVKTIFNRLTDDDPDAKELDLLHRLIETMKNEPGAEKSSKNWEQNSRVERRLRDMKCILDRNTSQSGLTEPFNVTLYDPNDCEIDCRSIRAYLDVGCGNGEITVAIGTYLNLKKNQIFGADVFDVRNPKLTFILIPKQHNQIRMPDNSVDLITCFVTLHHVPDMKQTIDELARVLRSNGFLIVREHNCETQCSIVPKYLNYVHAIMMIAKVEEFANVSDNDNRTKCWEEEKKEILQQIKSIQYRTTSQWDEEFLRVGFQPFLKFDYDTSRVANPQHLFYGVYRLNKEISSFNE